MNEISKQMATIEMYHIKTNWQQFTLIVCGGLVVNCDADMREYFMNRNIINIIDTLESEPSLGVTWDHEMIDDITDEELL